MPKEFRPAGDCWYLKVSMIKVKTTNLRLRAAMGSVPRIAQYHKQLDSDKACETKQVKSTVVILSGRGSKETTQTPIMVKDATFRTEDEGNPFR